jgi:hypothetical protein
LYIPQNAAANVVLHLFCGGLYALIFSSRKRALDNGNTLPFLGVAYSRRQLVVHGGNKEETKQRDRVLQHGACLLVHFGIGLPLLHCDRRGSHGGRLRGGHL